MKHFLDIVNALLVKKRGYGRYQKRVCYLPIGVNEAQKVLMPVGSQVVGLKVYLGEINLVVSLTEAAELEERVFYAFNDGQYMAMPDLAGIDTIVVGTTLWFVFEDDMVWSRKNPNEEDGWLATSHSSGPPKAASRRSWRPTRR